MNNILSVINDIMNTVKVLSTAMAILGLVAIGFIIYISYSPEALPINSTPPSVPQAPSQQDSFVPGEVIVVLRPGISVDDFRQYLSDYPEISYVSRDDLPNQMEVSLKDYPDWVAKAEHYQALYNSTNRKDGEQAYSLGESVKAAKNRLLSMKSKLDDENFVSKLELRDRQSFPSLWMYIKEAEFETAQNQIATNYPDLQVLYVYQTKHQLTVFVPVGKEEMWRDILQDSDMVEVADKNYIYKVIKDNTGVGIF